MLRPEVILQYVILSLVPFLKSEDHHKLMYDTPSILLLCDDVLSVHNLGGEGMAHTKIPQVGVLRAQKRWRARGERASEGARDGRARGERTSERRERRASEGPASERLSDRWPFSVKFSTICFSSDLVWLHCFAMKFQLVGALLLSSAPCTPAPPGKSTVSASDPMTSLAFNLKYLPVTVAQDNGVGDQASHGDTEIQGRVQVLQNSSYTARNCQLYSKAGATGSGSTYQSMTANGLGKACTYSSGKQYTSGTKLHMVFGVKCSGLR